LCDNLNMNWERPDSWRRWRRPMASALALATMVAMLLAAQGATARAATPRLASVIVRTVPGHEGGVAREIKRSGARVGLQLRIINGFAATVPTSALSTLSRDPAVLSVTPDASVRLSGGYDQSGDPYSLRNVEQAIRATNMWSAGYTGAGIDVALIDSGVTPVQGLSAPSNVVYGPDLSFESQSSNLRNLDTFGHGTFMAGIIAGRDDAAVGKSYPNDTTDFLGVAPDARIVSVKVADSHGNTDVSQVIAAIDWVVQHAHDPGLNIRVLNLSFGTDSTQSYILDPLAFAAEVAWNRGIAVVAAVGNAGISASGLADPAYDPYLIAVGAADHHGSMQYSQWTVAAFSQVGDGIRNPTILAPGAHLQSLRDPGSFIDQAYPGGVINSRFFRGSGSSQAAAVVSGALALMFQQHPLMAPDQAKALLKGQANSLRNNAGFGPKQGQLAIRLDTVLSAPVPIATTQAFLPSIGTGTLEGSRGTSHLVMDGSALQGEQDIFGQPFVAPAMAALEAAGNSWNGGTWNGNSWAGNSWAGNSWADVTWSGNSWAGNSWDGHSWDGVSWDGNSWEGNSWAGVSWDGVSWDGNSWASSTWG
jgi:serine protease AprX